MRLAIIPLVLALSACSLTPALVQPNAAVPAHYPVITATHGEVSAATLGWHAMFGDPRLRQLIDTALRHNQDLRLATLNVASVQAQYRLQRSAQLPSVEASAGATRGRAQDQLNGTGTSLQQQKFVQLGITAFELDLWGRMSAMSEAASARYLASEEAQRAAKISLVAAVADAYYAERLAEEQRMIADHILQSWNEQHRLASQLYKAGQGSRYDLTQLNAQLSRASTERSTRERELQRARNALLQLTGMAALPSDLPAPLALDRPAVQTRLAAGLPSDLLVERPDIRQAEQNLKAANADIGAARAAFLPRISLTASTGYASPALHTLFGSDQRTWNFSPQISQPLFDGGRLRAELRLSELRQQAAIAEYERAIQIALREVADGLAGSASFAQQQTDQQHIVAEAQRRTELSEQRYRAGLDSRTDYLENLRQYHVARQEMLSLQHADLSNAIALYKALGGGQYRVSARVPDAGGSGSLQ